MSDRHRVTLDKPRTLSFGHLQLRDLDEHLKSEKGFTFFEWLSNFPTKEPETAEEEQEATRMVLRGFDWGVVIAAYRFALMKEEGDFTDEEVAGMLDQADLEPMEQIEHLMNAHPMLSAKANGADGAEDSVPLDRRVSATT